MHHHPLLDTFFTIFWIFIWIMWIFLLIRVISDVFRSHDLSGGAKAAWTLVLIIFPLIGVLVYLIARGDGLHQREVRQAQANREAVRDYLNRAAGTTGSTAEELHRLADLRDRGVLTEDEFQRLKGRLVG
jgi:ABC-type multidrug transport system fused ATPase/permease subunit